jgi:hypothetical protein
LEKFKDVASKTIKARNVGGIAGGEKFIHEGIFYKFASDEHNLYKDIERAMKTSLHELKGLTALVDWELKTVGLSAVKFPLIVLIDYRGYRLAATSILPLGSSTLVIGSGDGGATIHTAQKGVGAGRASTARLGEYIQQWGKYLNIKEHEMISGGNSLHRHHVNVSIAFDLEVRVRIALEDWRSSHLNH